MTPRDVLVAARAKIADPGSFTLATRSLSDEVRTLDGAIWSLKPKRVDRAPYFAAKALLLDAMNRAGWTSLNDFARRGGSHEAALRIYDNAIAMAGEKR